MQKYDFNNLTDEQKKEIVDTISFRDKEDAEIIAKRNEVLDALEEEYPFLVPRGRDDEKLEMKPEERWCELLAMPEGWRRSFGLDICRDIKKALGDVISVQKYRILQIKEKYGSLRWYSTNESDEIANIITKYEYLSEHTCIVCGKPATKVSQGWISPYCDDCVKRMMNDDKDMPYEREFVPVDDYFGKLGEDRMRICYGFEDTGMVDKNGRQIHNGVDTHERWNWKESKWDFFKKVIETNEAREKRHEFFDKLQALKNPDVTAILKEYENYV